MPLGLPRPSDGPPDPSFAMAGTLGHVQDGRRPSHSVAAGITAVLLIALGIVSGRPQMARAQPDPVAACTIEVDKTASPRRVVLGEEVEITLSIAADCPSIGGGTSAADIVLVIDRSASMGDRDLFEPAIEAAGAFLDAIDFSTAQVGLVSFYMPPLSFASRVTVNQPLSSDAALVRTVLDGIPPPEFLTGGTDLAMAVNGAQNELESERRRPEANPVIVLLTDGDHNALFADDPIDAAQDIKDAGTTIVTVGVGVESGGRRTLSAMASRPELFFDAPGPEDLIEIYRAIAGAISAPGRVTELVLSDLLPAEVRYVDGSAVPPPTTLSGTIITWNLPVLPTSGWTIRYRVLPLVLGRYATNKLAYVDYLDADGTVATKVFPVPQIEVVEPDARARVYMPALYRDYCKTGRPIDIVLAIDTSTSMEGEKLEQGFAAAREFVGFLAMPSTQAGLITFDVRPELIEPLTRDRAIILSALSEVPETAEGTRLDLAVEVAVGELTGRRRDPANEPILVLLTDGRHAGAPTESALNAGAAARRAGITVFAIGIGADVDVALLEVLAGDPARVYVAEETADIRAVYRAVAGALPCE